MDAHESLSRADEAAPLAAADLELLARAAYMVGRGDDYVAGLERAHDLYLAVGDVPRAVRCAYWIGHNMLFRGRTARARGWFGRAKRALENDQRDGVDRCYLLIPVWAEQSTMLQPLNKVAPESHGSERCGDARRSPTRRNPLSSREFRMNRPPLTFMVRRGSTVRVRQSALQSSCKSAFPYQLDCIISSMHQVWSRLWSPQISDAARPRLARAEVRR
jgi:hypothetical protein